jgi:hypothetical protein
MELSPSWEVASCTAAWSQLLRQSLTSWIPPISPCIPLSLLSNGSVKTLLMQRIHTRNNRRIVRRLVFNEVRAVSKESRRLVIPRTCFKIKESTLKNIIALVVYSCVDPNQIICSNVISQQSFKTAPQRGECKCSINIRCTMATSIARMGQGRRSGMINERYPTVALIDIPFCHSQRAAERF